MASLTSRNGTNSLESLIQPINKLSITSHSTPATTCCCADHKPSIEALLEARLFLLIKAVEHVEGFILEEAANHARSRRYKSKRLQLASLKNSSKKVIVSSAGSPRLRSRQAQDGLVTWTKAGVTSPTRPRSSPLGFTRNHTPLSEHQVSRGSSVSSFSYPSIKDKTITSNQLRRAVRRTMNENEMQLLEA